MKILKKLAYYLWPKGRIDLKFRVILSLFCLALAKVINVYIPFIYKWTIDEFSGNSVDLIVLPVGLIFAYGGARILSQTFGEIRDFLFIRVSQNAQRTIALKTFKHLHSLNLQFHLERQTGGLSRIIERGTRGIQFVLTFMLFNILPTLLEIGMVTVILYFVFSLKFALITFFTIATYIAFTLFVTEWRLKYRKRMNAKDNEANTKAIDSLLNFETVKYFNNENHEFKRFDTSLAAYENAAVKSQSSLSLLNVGQGFIIGTGLIVLMYLAASGVVDKTMTIGDFVLINTYLIQLYLPLNFLGFVYREVKQSLLDMDQMFQLFEISQEVKDIENAVALKSDLGKIEFKNVQFSYVPERKILKQINFTANPGEKIAIVGSSGSGKSTIARLLFRFYDIQSGKILIDGQDIEKITQDSLRKSIGVVPQDTVLFNDTIYYNIAYGHPGACEKEIFNAAKMARVDQLIDSLPEGYQTKVGERGLKLSGGEKQRIAIARTILKKPKILIFDEATSALDSKTEKKIQISLNEIAKNRTTLIIAHRLSTIVDCDQILVMKNGEIIEKGTHAKLLRDQGEYALMWQHQQETLKEDSAIPTAL